MFARTPVDYQEIDPIPQLNNTIFQHPGKIGNATLVLREIAKWYLRAKYYQIVVDTSDS
jgi:hypothetical protein